MTQPPYLPQQCHDCAYLFHGAWYSTLSGSRCFSDLLDSIDSFQAVTIMKQSMFIPNEGECYKNSQ